CVGECAGGAAAIDVTLRENRHTIPTRSMTKLGSWRSPKQRTKMGATKKQLLICKRDRWVVGSSQHIAGNGLDPGLDRVRPQFQSDQGGSQKLMVVESCSV